MTEGIHKGRNSGLTDDEESNDSTFIVELDDSSFAKNIMLYEKIVVEFWKEFCTPCAIMKPIYNRVSASYADSLKSAMARVDLSQAVIRLFTVYNVPAFLFFYKGKVVDTIIGIVEEKDLEASFLKLSRM